MNELAAKICASQLANCWPGSLLASVEAPPKRTDEQGYVVRLAIPRRNRILRLTRETQLPGIVDVCAELLAFNETQRPVPAPLPDTEEEAMIEQHEQQETEEIPTPAQPAPVVFSEEEAATYLGVKVATIRTYAASGALQRQENGGYLLEDLRQYKEERDTRWGRPKKPTPCTPATGVSHVTSDPPGEVQLLQALIAHAFEIPGLTGLGRLSEIPRTWKLDVTTVRGPESYRVTRNVDGSFQHERW